ncbi:MAG: hypothetical protein II942_01815 [Alphaproteobacteria bacterium]|nr:hypothetical protein [Alphaproteobacteria bacterium]
MKKGLVLLGALALGACTTGLETDMDVAAAKREANIAERRQVSGCTFVRDHDAYRNCLLHTYQMNQPATYTTSTMNDGRSVVVTTQNQQPGAVAGSTACGLKPLPVQEPGYEWAAPTTVSHTQSVETVCQKRFEPQQTVIQTVEENLNPPPPEVVFVEPEQPVVVEAPKPVRKWKRPAPVAPKCPCEDPNDPCPQCYDK